MAAGSLDGDGRIDLAVGHAVASQACALHNRADGGWGTACATVGGSVRDLVMDDFNRDGRLDIAVARGGPGGIQLMYGAVTGPMSAVPGPAVDAGYVFSALAAGDIDRDGVPDLAAVAAASPQAWVFAGGRDGGFAPAFGSPLAVGNNPTAVALPDLDGDGRLDLVVASTAPGTVATFVHQAGVLARLDSFAVGAGPRSVAFGDWDGDGTTDVAVACQVSQEVELLFGRAGGRLATGSAIAGLERPTRVVAADVDRDGQVDLVVVHGTDTSGNWLSAPDRISLLRGVADRTGTFHPPRSYGVGTDPAGLAAADLDGDGRLDLAVANQGADSVSLLFAR